MESFILTNKKQNPNTFNAKIGKSYILKKNSEIALEHIKFTNNTSVTLNDSNNTFVLQFGQNGMKLNNNSTTEPSLNFMPPEVFKINNGQYILNSDSSTIFDVKQNSTIMSGLITALNSSKYFMWGWAAEYPTVSTANLLCYVKSYSVGPIHWGTFHGNQMIIGYNGATAAIAGYNTIRDTLGGYISYSNSRTPIPMHSDFKVATANNPNYSYLINLPAHDGTLVRMSRFFAGFTYNKHDDIEILEQSETIGGVIFNRDVITHKFPICVELINNEVVFLLKNHEGIIINSHNTGIFYTAAEIYISFTPLITNDITGAAPEIETKQYVTCYASDGTTIFSDNFILDSTFIGHDYYLGVCSKSENILTGVSGALTIITNGVTESRVSNLYADRLGQIDHNILNMTAILSVNRVIKNTILLNDTTTNYDFSRLTRQANLYYLTEDDESAYMIDDLSTTIDIQIGPQDFNLCLCIDNLPLKSFLCDPELGTMQKRIYTIYRNIVYGKPVIEHALNLKFVKLHNKEDIYINSFDVKFINIDGSETQALEGNVYVNIVIKQNNKIENKKFRDNQNYDMTEKTFELKNNIV